MAHLLAGAYRRQARELSDSVRREVWARDKGTCVSCGNAAAEIDHIDGDSPDLSNLQLLCADCHHAKTAERMVPASEQQRRWIEELYSERVVPEVPSLLCDDDEVHWATKWRALKSERKQRLLEMLSDMGYDRSEFRGIMSWADMWEDILDTESEGLDDGGWSEDDDSGYGPYSYFAHAMAKDD